MKFRSSLRTAGAAALGLGVLAVGYAGRVAMTLFMDIWPVIVSGIIGAVASFILYKLGIPHAFLPEAAALTAIVTTIYKENK